MFTFIFQIWGLSDHGHSKDLDILLVLYVAKHNTYKHEYLIFSSRMEIFQTNIPDLSNINLKCFHV